MSDDTTPKSSCRHCGQPVADDQTRCANCGLHPNAKDVPRRPLTGCETGCLGCGLLLAMLGGGCTILAASDRSAFAYVGWPSLLTLAFGLGIMFTVREALRSDVPEASGSNRVRFGRRPGNRP